MSLLSPRSIAVIGASATPGKVGHEILKNLLTQGFSGEVIPINPKGGEILGKKAFISLKELPKTPDLAVIATPAATVPGILEECVSKSIRDAIVISAGFSETHTEEGETLETRVRGIARSHGIRLIGPNCLGVLRPGIGMNASFAKNLPPRGGIALISQSGATAVGLMDEAAALGLGFSVVLSIGNKTILDESDMLEIVAADPETKAIGLYLESIRDGRRFLNVAKRITPGKPIVLLKAGVSQAGSRAASSHTGALAGSSASIEALSAQTGITRAEDLEEFTDLLAALSMLPALPSPQIAVITNAGGPGILATDAAEKLGLTFPPLEESGKGTLAKALPAAASMGNPIDVLGDADAGRYRASVDICAKDPGVDGLCILLTPQVMTPCEEIARVIVEAHRKHPLIPIVTSFVGEESVIKARNILHEGNVPSFPTPERAVRALATLRSRVPQPGTAAAEQSTTQPHPGACGEPRRATGAGGKPRNIIGNTPSGLVSPDRAYALFHAYGITLPKQALARNADEAVAVAEKIGYPVIAKIGGDVLHKTDIGGVKGNLRNAQDVRTAFKEIAILWDKNIFVPQDGSQIPNILIQEFLPGGHEFIVGMTRDPAFGPLIMIGLGGIYTELFRDTAFRIAPLDEREAYRMLQELLSWPLLLGARGLPQSDIPALAGLITKISQMALEEPRIAELDCNPVLVSAERIVLADVKVVVE